MKKELKKDFGTITLLNKLNSLSDDYKKQKKLLYDLMNFTKGEARHETLKEELKFLKKLRKILNEYHSQMPMVEIGRQNVKDDIDNELKLDERIAKLEKELKGK